MKVQEGTFNVKLWQKYWRACEEETTSCVVRYERVRDRYVMYKRKKKLCTFPIYSVIIMFIFFCLVLKLFLFSRLSIFIYFFNLLGGSVQCVLECSLRLHFCKRLWFNPKASHPCSSIPFGMALRCYEYDYWQSNTPLEEIFQAYLIEALVTACHFFYSTVCSIFMSSMTTSVY